jgi:hypothetical protein
VIGLLEVARVTQNLNSVTFQPFVLFTAAAGMYVLAAFFFDFVFRVIEKSLTTPPTGGIAGWITGRRKRRIALVVKDLEALSGRT